MKNLLLLIISISFSISTASCKKSLALVPEVIDLNPDLPENFIINHQQIGGNISVYLYEEKIIPEIRWTARGINLWSEHGDLELEKMSCVISENEKNLTISSKTNSEKVNMQRMDLVVLLPANINISINNKEGNVFIRNFKKNLYIKTSHGSIVAKTKEAIKDDIILLNDHGNAILRSAPGSRGKLDFEAVNGNVKANLRSGSVIITSKSNNKNLKGLLNEGDNTILLRSANGVSRFDVVQKPLESHGEMTLPLTFK